MVLPQSFNIGKYYTLADVFLNVTPLQLKTSGVDIDSPIYPDGIVCNEAAGSCSFVYDFQGMLLDAVKIWGEEVRVTASFSNPLTGYKAFDLDFFSTSSGGCWKDGNVWLNYLVFCR